MRAVCYNKYGDTGVLVVDEAQDPAPEPGRVVAHVKYASANPIDCKIRSGAMKMVLKRKFPIIPGVDFSGIVTAVGEGVDELKIGDRIYGCVETTRQGTHAELVSAPVSFIGKLPKNIDYREAASLPCAAGTAYQGLVNIGQVETGNKVLISGATGGVGSMAVQIANILGAEVTAVCHGSRVEVAKQFGPAHILHYDERDFKSKMGVYDVFFDCAAAYTPSFVKGHLAKRGRYISTLPTPTLFVLGIVARIVGGRKFVPLIFKANPDEIDTITKWVDEGRLKPFITEELEMSEAVKTHQWLETPGTTGKLVLKQNLRFEQ